MMVSAIESYYKDKITILKEKIGSERFERQIAKNSQQQVSFSISNLRHSRS